MSSQTQNDHAIRRKKSSNRYRVYVGVITASTLLLIALLVWPFSVGHFKTTTRMRMAVEPTAIHGKTTDQIVAMSIVRNTTDEKIAQLLRETRGVTKIKSGLLDETQTMALRDSIEVGTRPGRNPNEVEIQISIAGEGTADEVDFINRFANAVAADIVSMPTTIKLEQLIADWRADFSHSLSEQSKLYSDVTALLKTQLAIAVQNKQAFLQTAANGTTPSAAMPGSTDQPGEISAINLQYQISELHKQIQQQKTTNGWQDDHPELVHYFRAIDRLKAQLNQSYRAANATRIKNPFMNASASTVINNVNEDSLPNLNEIDSALAIISELDQQLKSDLKTQRMAIDQLQSQWQASCSHPELVTLEKLELAKDSEPIGGTPNSKQLFIITVIAFGLGGIMALQFTPDMRIERFRSAEHAESALGLPMIGVIDSSDDTDPVKPRQRFAMLTFRVCEMALLFMVIMLIIAMLVNSDIFSAFMQNPFQAVSKFIWTITPR